MNAVSPRRRSLKSGHVEPVIVNLERWARAVDAHRTWLTRANTAMRFYEGDQWSKEDREKLAGEGRPCLTLNQINPLVRLVLGYERQNRYDLIARPASDPYATEQVAEILTHAMKMVMDNQHAGWKLSQVFRDGLVTGRGYLEVEISTEENALGHIALRELNPYNVLPDPHAEHYDPKSWGFVLKTKWASLSNVEAVFGRAASEYLVPFVYGNKQLATLDGLFDVTAHEDEAPPVGFGEMEEPSERLWDDSTYGTGGTDWSFLDGDMIDRQRRLVRLVDQEHKKLRRGRFWVDTVTGDKNLIPPEADHNRISQIIEWQAASGRNPLTVIEEPYEAIRRTITAADAVLYDEWSPYKTYTVIPYFPTFRRGMTRGMVDDLIDAQREINVWRSAAANIMARTAHGGVRYEKTALSEESKQALEDFGGRPGFHLEVEDGKLGAIQDQPPIAPPIAQRQIEDAFAHDLKKISGINDSAMGQLDRVQSGRAIEARQRQAVTAIEVYLDNLGRTRHFLGRKLIELIQSHYTEERIVRIVGENGKMLETAMNQRNAAGHIMNDVSLGRYAIDIDEAPMSATFQQGQFDEAMQLVEKGFPIPADVMIDLSSMPRKEEIKQRLLEQQQAEAQAQAQAAVAPEPALAAPEGGVA